VTDRPVFVAADAPRASAAHADAPVTPTAPRTAASPTTAARDDLAQPVARPAAAARPDEVEDGGREASAPAASPASATATTTSAAATNESLVTPLGLDAGRDRIAGTAADRPVLADPARAVPLAEVPQTIAARSRAGHSRFDVRLTPEDLGGIDVRVEVRSSGEVRAHLVVERTETLDLMLRDQKTLERSLADAGLDVGSSGLQFSLKQQSSGGNGQGWRAYDGAADRIERRAETATETAPVAPVAAAATRPSRLGGIDLRV